MGRTIKFRVWDKVLNGWRIVEMREDNTYYEFTGLHDKNGKEMYEGDIVMYAERQAYLWVVKWDINRWIIEQTGTQFPFQYLLQDNQYEIIGNIYENPELLQEASNG